MFRDRSPKTQVIINAHHILYGNTKKNGFKGNFIQNKHITKFFYRQKKAREQIILFNVEVSKLIHYLNIIQPF